MLTSTAWLQSLRPGDVVIVRPGERITLRESALEVDPIQVLERTVEGGTPIGVASVASVPLWKRGRSQIHIQPLHWRDNSGAWHEARNMPVRFNRQFGHESGNPDGFYLSPVETDLAAQPLSFWAFVSSNLLEDAT